MIAEANSGIRTVAELNTTDFSIVEKCYSPGTLIGRHSHENLVVSFPLVGTFVESNSLTSYTCERHGLSLNPAGESHINNFRHGHATCLVVSSATAESSRFVEAPCYVRDITAAGFALRIHRELFAQDSVSPLMAQGLVLEMLAFAARTSHSRRKGDRPKWLGRVRDHIHANFSEPQDLDELSLIAGVHQTTLSRQFRQHYSRSIGDYIRELRLQRSMTELADPNTTLAEIACNAGFYDQSHFTNAFKRYTGMTPAEFRRRQL